MSTIVYKVNSIKSQYVLNSQNLTIQGSKVREKDLEMDEKLITDQIRELAKLRDDGILTEEEFTEKKKVLLGKIS